MLAYRGQSSGGQKRADAPNVFSLFDELVRNVEDEEDGNGDIGRDEARDVPSSR